ncbi:MAG: hypothetical protein J7641_09435 [Cyanobacteria bacterium SID2]|nr:hypothetical protein [Cyanobacteria bacterium SID2]MBP0005679.1 hypothetical protein [Cyanobacteria bacterium SBC]
MTTETDLPLRLLFDRLRKAGFPLGTADYLLLFDALKTQVYPPTKDSFRQLCQTLWVKSASQRQQFESIFDDVFVFPEIETSQKRPSRKPKHQRPELEREPDEEPSIDRIPPADTTTDTEEDTNEYYIFPPSTQPSIQLSNQPVFDEDLVSAVRQGRSREWTSFQPCGIEDEYLPATAADFTRSWYTLRQTADDDTATELDIAATIDSTRERGKFVVPVLKPRRVKLRPLVLLLDWGGSMQPFHVLARQLVATATQTGCLAPEGQYYFHNVPNGWLSMDSEFQTDVPLDRVTVSWHPERTTVLIFSDAGAGRRDFQSWRVRETRTAIATLRTRAKTVVWLSPFPKADWRETTAEAIAATAGLSMFSIDRSGFQAAVRALRGGRP